ncbi:MAG TPA: hypothetical protein VGD60_11185 [Candidatus Acidoferrales bacterium]
MRGKTVPSVLLTLTMLFAGTAVRSTTLVRMSVAQMTQTAQLVIRARCVENSVRWDHGEIWTFTTFAIEETWKGPFSDFSNQFLRIRLLGGTVGHFTSNVSGIPRFSPGEEVVLFLEPSDPKGCYSVVSWLQGTFRVQEDLRTGQVFAMQDSASFDTFDASTHQFRESGLRNIRIEDLRDLVAAADCSNRKCVSAEKK